MATQVLFFGRLRDVAGTSSRQIDLADGEASVEALIRLVSEGNQALRDALQHPAVKIAVDQRMIGRGASVAGAREIAFMPPFSGG